MKPAKTYVLTVEVDEGYDEFWEDVAKGRARTKVKEEIKALLVHHPATKSWSLTSARLGAN